MENFTFTGIALFIVAVNIFLAIAKATGKIGNSKPLLQSYFQKKTELAGDKLSQAIQAKEVDKILNFFIEESNLNVNKIYNTGETPLMLAVKTGDATVVKVLLDKGARVNVQDTLGNSPMSLAQKAGHKDIEAFLQSALRKGSGLFV